MNRRGFVLSTAAAMGCASAPPSRMPVLQLRLETLARAFDGEAGVCVIDLQSGESAGVRAENAFQQQSVFKAWVAIAALDAAERGALSLNETLTVTEADLNFPYRPLAELVAQNGPRQSVRTLVEYMAGLSDNASVDLVIRRLGGVRSVQSALQRKGLGGLRVDLDERGLHDVFNEVEAARRARPRDTENILRAYLADERNTASPRAAAQAFQALAEGRVLSRTNTAYLLRILSETPTGPARLRAGLPAAWGLAHKTGTGSDLGEWGTAVNDVGLLTGPYGRRYAVAVMVGRTRAPMAAREAFIADVARAVVDISGA